MTVNNKIIIGLTGTIASGKTTVSEFYRTLGAGIVDADIVSREVLLLDKVALKALQSEFPNCFGKNELLRAKLKAEVFNNCEKLNCLNAIMFPAIKRLCEKQIDECSAGIVLLVAPLLFESGFDKMADKIICVTCDSDTRIRRLTKRDSIDEALANKIIASQMGEEEKLEKSDFIISTEADSEVWKSYAKKVYDEIAVNLTK